MQLHGAPKRASLRAGEGALAPGRRLRPVQAAADKPAAKAAAVDSERLTLRLSTHYQAQFGEQLKVVGSAPELGGWDVEAAPALDWSEGHFWQTDLQLPRDADIRFKVVLLSHSGVQWEPCSDRALDAPLEADELAVRLAWGVPELELLQPATEAAPAAAAAPAEPVSEPLPAAQASVDEQFDSLWNPVSGGLPADITAELAAPQEREPKQKHGVTLEPEHAIFAEEEAEPLPAAAPIAAATTTAALQPELTAKPQRAAEPAPAAAPAPVVRPPTHLAPAEAERELPEPVAAAVAEEAASRKGSALRTAGQAAGVAAAGVAAAVLFSALAVDLTDAAVASAVVAAGATLLPGTVDADGRKKANAGKGGASPLLGAVELGLKAQALLSGRKGKGKKGGKSAEEEDGEGWEELLPRYVAAKSAQAGAWAAAFQPTEEELFEMMAPQPSYARVQQERYANNAVSTGGMGSRKPSDEPAGKRK